MAKAVLGVPTTSALIERLDVDKFLRRISAGSDARKCLPKPRFPGRSRIRARRAARQDPRRADRAAGGGHLGGSGGREEIVEAREKLLQITANDGKTIPRLPIIPRRRASADVHASANSVRGRSRRVLKRQVKQNAQPDARDLPTACDVGCKKNSKGYKETWTGYKLHIDVACGQIPVSCVLTSASVHDSQVAIPLMTMTSARVAYLYDLMDAAYDAAAIHDQSRTLGHAPIVDRRR